MIHALSPAGLAALQAVAAADPLVVLDFDGTLAPIVEKPGDARMREPTAALLHDAAAAYRCAVLSGRARADVAARLAGAPLVAVFGNHGAEVDDAPPRAVVRGQVRAWAAALADALKDEEGVEVEGKEFTLTVHFRRAPSPEDAERRIRSLVAGLPGARVSGGHAVVNVAPWESRTKGDALALLATRLRPRAVLYVGDDDTDEDAFRAPQVSLGVRVGRTPGSAARFYVGHQGEVDDLLRALVAARAPSTAGGPDAAGPRPPSDGAPE